jgi:hypothetical protein
LVVGAAKCGTSSLHNYLDGHPEIGMSGAKELNFFIHPDYKAKVDTYMSFFDGTQRIRGESSPYYMCDPLAPDVPVRIASLVPDARLIMVVRDPVDRLVSHYIDDFTSRRETRPFSTAVLGSTRDPYNRYIAPGRYGHQLERYLDCFDSRQILVITQRDLRTEREQTLTRVFHFLGVETAVDLPSLSSETNTRESKRVGNRLYRTLRQHRAGDRLRSLPVKQRYVEALIARTKRRTSSSFEPPRLSSSDRKRLEEVFANDAERLRELTGLALPDWSV